MGVPYATAVTTPSGTYRRIPPTQGQSAIGRRQDQRGDREVNVTQEDHDGEREIAPASSQVTGSSKIHSQEGDMRRNGRFAWYELLTTDVPASIAFYREIMGWDTQKWQGPMDYVLWTVGETPIGGVARLSDEAQRMGAPPHWVPYVGVANVDATAMQAEGLGARVRVPPTDIPGAGRISVLTDPQGAVFALHESGPGALEMARPEPPTPGAISWHELLTDDFEVALSFYAVLFGWQRTESMDMGPLGTYQMYGKDGRTLGGMMNRPEDMLAPPHWLLYTYVGDLDGALAKVRVHGGQVLNGPMDIPGGDRVAQCLDAQGAAFALHGK
jgi:predicted enzyme related to lactoylglutathione lyase